METSRKVLEKRKGNFIRRSIEKAKVMATQNRDAAKPRDSEIDLESNVKEPVHWVKFTQPELAVLLAMANYSRAWIKKSSVARPELMKSLPAALKEIDKIEDKFDNGNALECVDNVWGFDLF